MKVKRQQEIDMVIHDFMISDQVTITLDGFGTFTATAQKVMDCGTLFLFDDCVCRKSMNQRSTNKGGFAESSLRKWMNEELFEAFPDDLKELMVQFDNGDNLTLPSYGQMFGHDDFYEDAMEPDQDEQLELMKNRKNRVCDCDGDWCWYWLSNATKKEWSASAFAYVDAIGAAHCGNASSSNGVRPAFLIA